ETVWVTRGYCVQQHGPREAYLPFLDALDRLAREAPSTFAELLRRYAPTWLGNLPWLRGDRAAAPAVPAEHAPPQRMRREFCAFIEAATATRPLILALEDVHWSDPSTVDLLYMLAQRREPARLFVIGTYRPAELVTSDHGLWSVQQTLRARRQSREIALQGLGVNDLRAYLSG